MSLPPLVDLALTYAKEHDEEILTYAYEQLKKLVEAKLAERRKAQAAMAKDDADLAEFRAKVDKALKDLPE